MITILATQWGGAYEISEKGGGMLELVKWEGGRCDSQSYVVIFVTFTGAVCNLRYATLLRVEKHEGLQSPGWPQEVEGPNEKSEEGLGGISYSKLLKVCLAWFHYSLMKEDLFLNIL